MLRNVWYSFLKPFSRLLLRTVSLEDAWERYPASVPLARFGVGSRRDFPWYFEGCSSVAVQSLEEVQTWLMDCAYVRDPDLFHEPDFWQHPCTFEQLRRGDCEDFSIWVWRKLVELGYEAELVAGRSLQQGARAAGHVWVLFTKNDTRYLFDPVVRDRQTMIQPLEKIRHAYVPEVSVDNRFDRYAYAGYYILLRGSQRKAAPRAGFAQPVLRRPVANPLPVKPM